MERDAVKLWQPQNVKFAIIGLENQTKSEKDMPLRVIGYDGNTYRSQLLNKGKERYPVVTLVLYFGKGHWNQPQNLSKVVSVPEELENYFSDYKINVFEISWLTDEQVSMFRSDFRVVADYFTQMRKNNTYTPSKQTLVHVDEVLKLLSVFGEDKRFAEFTNKENGSEVQNMCEWLDIVEQNSREQAREQTIQLLVKAGIKLDDKAMIALNVSKEEYDKAEKALLALV